MGSKTTKQTSTNTYGYAAPPPPTPEFDAYKSAKFDNTMLSPVLDAQFNQARRNVDDQYDSPWNGVGSSIQRNAMHDQAINRLQQTQGLVTAQSNLSNSQQNINKLYSEALYTRPQLTQTGGTTTTKQGGNWLQGIIGMGLMAAAPFTGGATLGPGLGMLGGSSGGSGGGGGGAFGGSGG